MSDLVNSTVAETIHTFENTTRDILEYAEDIVKKGQYYYQEERKRENINRIPKAEVFTQIFANIPSSHVDTIPWNVNGNKHFVIKIHEGKWTDKIKMVGGSTFIHQEKGSLDVEEYPNVLDHTSMFKIHVQSIQEGKAVTQHNFRIYQKLQKYASTVVIQQPELSVQQ